MGTQCPGKIRDTCTPTNLDATSGDSSTTVAEAYLWMQQRRAGVQSLVLAPTRELATQILGQVHWRAWTI